MVRIFLTIGYCVILVVCFLLLDNKYETALPSVSWFVLLITAIILGRISKRLDKYLANTYLFFGAIFVLLLVLIEPFYELLAKLTNLF